MKLHIFSLLILSIVTFQPGSAQSTAHSQSVEVLDTIYANDTKNVALFFPEPIRQGITGSDNFIFTYNREKEQYFGLLQAQPGKESNLLVINRNGSVFSYIVRYKKQLSKLNYFIPLSSSIGNEKPLANDCIQAAPSEKGIDNKAYHYQKFCSYLLERKQHIGRVKTRNEGIILSVENIVFDKEALYFVIEITNTSSLDYDVNFLEFSVQTRKKGRRKSMQRLIKEPVFNYNIPDRIPKHNHKKMVVVIPKFSISDDKRVVVVLHEKKGERNITLKISHRFINNPN